MLSIEEIKLLIEKLEKVKSADLQKLIDSNLKILKDLEAVVDANNSEQIRTFNKPLNWFRKDLEQKIFKLDEFEGKEYKRIITEVTLEDNTKAEAYIYELR